jgi:hypothetical protein
LLQIRWLNSDFDATRSTHASLTKAGHFLLSAGLPRGGLVALVFVEFADAVLDLNSELMLASSSGTIFFTLSSER